MVKLPKWAIKKYGISRAAWKAAKKGRKGRGKTKMAKKRRSNNGSRGAGLPSWSKTVIGGLSAVGWGYVRGSVAEKMPAVHPSVAGYSDELVFATAAGVASILPLGGAGKYVRLATKPILNAELAKIGEKMKAGVKLNGQ